MPPILCYYSAGWQISILTVSCLNGNKKKYFYKYIFCDIMSKGLLKIAIEV